MANIYLNPKLEFFEEILKELSKYYYKKQRNCLKWQICQKKSKKKKVAKLKSKTTCLLYALYFYILYFAYLFKFQSLQMSSRYVIFISK